IAEEYYFSVLLDRSNRTYLAMCSKEGGMEIEQLAVERPDALAKIPVSAIDGINADKAAEIAQAAGFDAETAAKVGGDLRGSLCVEIAQAAGFDTETAAKVAPVLTSLWTVFENEDATL